MDVSLKFEAWREKIKRSMPREPLMIKLRVVFGALVTLVATLVLGTYQMKQWHNVLVIQNNFNNTVTYNNTLWENSTFYDIQFINGTYTDEKAANDLKLTINGTCDYDCQKKGCNWSITYAFAGFVMVLTALNALFLVVGGWFYKARMISMFCHGFLTFFSLISIIVTARMLFRDQGQLASMSTMPSRTISDTAYDKTWTYQDDYSLIQKLLWTQVGVLVVCMLTASLGCCVRRKDNVTDSMVPQGALRNSQVPIRASDNQALLTN